MFLTDYDDMFAYGVPLNLESYLAWGWGAILGNKAQARLLNLQRLWVEGFLIVLLPFSALGVWRLYRGSGRDVLWPFLLYLPLLFVAMTLVFTFPGVRGGLFHSAGALLPFIFATTGPGLEAAVRWAARHVRGWRARQAWQVFAVGLVCIVLVVTGLALWRAGIWDGEWNRRDEGYRAIGQWLEAEGAAGATVMVGNAPGFVWYTGHPAVAIPNNNIDIILFVADRYDVRYLVLDAARPRTTDGLYAGEETHPRLVLRAASQAEAQPWQLYEVEQ
jgi:hypothetical protein